MAFGISRMKQLIIPGLSALAGLLVAMILLASLTNLVTAAPIANDDTFRVLEDSSSTYLDVLINDTPLPLTITMAGAGSAGGTIVVSGTAGIDYTPAPNFDSLESFTYTVNDGMLGSNATATVTVVITPVNDSPTIANIADQVTAKNTPKTITFTVGDIDDPVISLTLAGRSSNPFLLPEGSISFGGSGISRTVSLTPATNLTGTALVTLTVSDNSLTATDSFILEVEPVTSTLFLPVIIRLANTQLFVSSNNTGGFTYQVWSGNALVTSCSAPADVTNLSCGEFPPGTYLIKVFPRNCPAASGRRDFPAGPVYKSLACQ